MVNIAARNLWRDPWRLAISAGGLAFAVLLMLFLHATYVGQIAQAGAFVDNAGADLWVTQEDTRDLFHGQSTLPGDLAGELALLPGVVAASPLMGKSVHVASVGDGADLFLVGYDPTTGMGGPWSMHSGRLVQGGNDIVVDRVFASVEGVDIGDDVTLGNATFEVVGISRGASTLFSNFAFIHVDAARALAPSSDVVNYYLLEVDGSPGSIVRAVEEMIPASKTWTRDDFSEVNSRGSREAFLPVIATVMVLGFVVGAVVVGLTVYTATMERRAEYGVLKAMGAPQRKLGGMVLQYSIVSTALGTMMGVALTFLADAIAEWLIPQMRADITWAGIGSVVVAAVLITGVATLLPVRRIASLDPAEVFRV